MRLVVVTGVSGAGKSTALRALEDLGLLRVDNLPLPLVPQFVELLASRPEIDRAALGLDARGGDFLDGRLGAIFADLRKRGHTVEVLFLDASDEILMRRFSETRRRHPLSDTDIRAGIAAERQTLARPARRRPSALVDTGALNVHQLRALIQERYGRGEGDLAVTLLSFGFKHGLPAEADIVLDVRFLPNPFFVPAPVGAVGRGRGGGPLRARRPGRRGVPRRGREAAAAAPCRGSSARASRTPRSRSAAPAAATARWRSPRSWPGAWAAALSISVRHRDIQRERLEPSRCSFGPGSDGGRLRGLHGDRARQARPWSGSSSSPTAACGDCLLRRGRRHRRPGGGVDRGRRSRRREAFDDIVRRVGRACDEVDAGAGS